MNPDFTDVQLADLEKEVGSLIANLSGPVSTASESEERVERIMRMARLEERIRRESDSSSESDSSGA